MPDRPHVVVLSHRVPFPPNKGDKIRTYHQIRRLREEGFDVSVCTLVGDGEEEGYLRSLGESLDVRTFAARPGARWSRMARGLLGRRPISVGFFFSERLLEIFSSFLATTRVDAIMCTSSSMAEYVFRAPIGEDGDRPFLVMDFMDMDSEKWRQYAQRAAWPRSWIFQRESRLLGRYERRAYRRFDASLFVSAKEAELFVARTGESGERLHAVGNGVELDAQPPPPVRPSGSAGLLFTGVMDYFPNEDAMVWFHETMWPQILSRWPEARLTIAGMRPTRRLRSMGRHENIEVTGFVDDISRYYAEADLFVAPFRIARGIQNKLLQAFAAGVPVVTTRAGAEGLVCTDEVDVIIADEPDDFVNAVDLLLRDPAERERLRDNARRLVESRYSWTAQTRALTELLREATAARPARRPDHGDTAASTSS